MLHVRTETKFSLRSDTKQEALTMERISRALGFAVALGTGGLMFALTLV
jgi:hypothetical protein